MNKRSVCEYPLEKHKTVFMYNDLSTYYKYKHDNSSKLRRFFENMDKRIFYLISASKGKEDYPSIVNVNGINLYYLWVSIYPVIIRELNSPSNLLLKEKILRIERAEVFVFLVILDYICGFYSNYGTEKDNFLLRISSRIFDLVAFEFKEKSFREQRELFFDLISIPKKDI